jgi:Cof subfamily protein (haloacid dehalogenase superfamily)
MGVIVMVATGRGYSELLHLIPEFNLPQDKLHVCCYNGSVVVEFAKGSQKPERLFADCIDPSDCKHLIDLCTGLGIVVQYYNSDTGDIIAAPKTEEHRAILKRYADLCQLPQVLVDDYEEAYKASGSAKLLAMTRQPDDLMELVGEKFPGMFHMIRGSPNPFFVEFLPPGICKGNGLKRFCEIMDIDLSTVVAFGDGENDKEMLEYAGIGVAMKNGKDMAKAAADICIEVSNYANIYLNLLYACVSILINSPVILSCTYS